jgi:hypothetical protein
MNSGHTSHIARPTALAPAARAPDAHWIAREPGNRDTMGIKFYCPNGHKLHVKAFLSGKKAICPKCGARVVVPSAVPEAAVADPRSGLAASTGETLEAALVDDALESMSSLPAEMSEVARAATIHPIEEAPTAVWYVRPATGGQYGPASGQIMRSWLKDGRVSANSLVWRDGWSEWRSAADAFPELGSQPAPPGEQRPNGMPPLPASLPLGQVVEGVAAVPASINQPAAMPPLAHAARRRRRKNDLRLILSAGLAVLSLILVIVLVLVFRAQNKPAEAPASEPAAQEPPAADEAPRD